MRTTLTTTGTSLLTNTARELNKKAASVTDEELQQLSHLLCHLISDFGF
ncbi:MAG: hypothetical protein V7L14_28665 [Nostoc sp.]